MLGGGLGTSFVSVHGIKLVVSKWYVGGTLFGLSGGDIYVEVLGREDVMYDGK